jgi:hypothetical protein
MNARNTQQRRFGIRKILTMIPVYRFSLGRWALFCLLFVGGATLSLHYYPKGIDLNSVPPSAAGLSQRPSDNDILPCRNIVYSVSEDGVPYVRETGGGTVFAARLGRRVGFYRINPYGYMMRIDQNGLDEETVGRLSKALLQCEGPWLPSGAWFSLSAKRETAPQRN